MKSKDHSAGKDAGNGRESVENELIEVAEETVDRIEDEPDDLVEAAKQQRDALDEFTTAVAEAEVAPARINTARWISMVAETKRSITKTEIKDAVETKVEEKRQGESGRPTLDTWLEENIEKIIEVRSTDQKQNTIWRWETAGDRTIETSSTQDGIEHMRFDKLRDAIYEGTGVWLEKPSEGRRSGEEWQDDIVDFVERNRIQKTTRGQRTIATDRLKDWVRQHNAYTTHLDAIEFGGMRIERETGEIHIQNQYIKRWCDSAEITTRALQTELDSRGLLSDRVGGASEQTTVEIDGQYKTITYWVIDLDTLDVEPYEIVEDPDSPAEIVEEKQREKKSTENGESKTDTHHDETGVVAQIGGDENAGDGDE
jgi:hypothetical protein